jgi:Spy/CpxP family protein refolding chaperone
MTKSLTLTDAQKAKFADIEKEFGPKLVAAQKACDVLTPEQKKAREDAAKTAKTAGKSGKEIHQAADAAVKLTDDQKAKQADAKKQAEALRKELREKVVGVLTQEQKDQIKAAHGKKAK